MIWSGVLQSGRRVPQRDSGGGVPHDRHLSGMGGGSGCGEGGQTLCFTQHGLPEAAAGV